MRLQSSGMGNAILTAHRSPPSRDATPPPGTPGQHRPAEPEPGNSLCANNSGPQCPRRLGGRLAARLEKLSLAPAPQTPEEREGGGGSQTSASRVPLGVRSHLQVSAPRGRPRGAGPGAWAERASLLRAKGSRSLFPFLSSAPSLPRPHQTAGPNSV